MMLVRGVRGAACVAENTEEAILETTRVLLQELIALNAIEESYVASVLFTTTADLTATFPAKAARDLGWNTVALMGALEMNAEHGLKMCVRILIHWNTTKAQDEIKHVYMRGAEALRRDLFPQS
mgnify:FL=1|jgi:chorismate mutase